MSLLNLTGHVRRVESTEGQDVSLNVRVHPPEVVQVRRIKHFQSLCSDLMLNSSPLARRVGRIKRALCARLLEAVVR